MYLTRRFMAPLRRMARISALLAGVCTAAFLPLKARADGSASGVVFDPPARLVLGIGLFNADDVHGNAIPNNNHASIMLRAEYRSSMRLLTGGSGKWRWGVGPQVGGLINGDSGAMVSAGLFADFIYNERFVLSPAFNVGVYSAGDGRDLGGMVEFEEAMTFAWALENQHRIGLTLSHISNGNIYGNNPGVETILLNYSMPVGKVTPLPGLYDTGVTAISHGPLLGPPPEKKDSEADSP